MTVYEGMVNNMEMLENYIRSKGQIIGDDIVKVDMFLNHQVDMNLMNEMGLEFKRLFAHKEITKVLTLEVSGIAIAAMAALHLNVPMVFAKKIASRNTSKDVYESEVYSFTKDTTYTIRVSKEYLSKDDKVLIIDDFLANGKAMLGLIDLTKQAGCEVAGLGIAIEKSFQKGSEMLKDMGYELHSLAIIDSVNDNKITFGKE